MDYLEDLSALAGDLAAGLDSAPGFDSLLDFGSAAVFPSVAGFDDDSEATDLVSVDDGFSPVSALAAVLYASLR